MFTITQTTNIEPNIRRAYASDQALIDRWHIVSGTGLENCVKDTMRVLTQDTFPDFSFYLVEENGRFVGYFGNEADRSYLNTFFIAPEMRPRKREFWNAVLELMEPVFVSALYSKNIPGIRFYEKMGRRVEELRVPSKPDTLTLFKFEKVGS